MDSESEHASEAAVLEADSLPDGLTSGSTILVATAGDPSRMAVGLRLLSALGTADETAFVVTTTESADATVDTYGRVGGAENPALRLVDTASRQQFVSAVFDEIPVVYTPSAGDLERLVMALSELSGDAPSGSTRHLLVRSLTPILEAAPTERVDTVLGRITGLRSEDGYCLLGVDFTAHDEETMAVLADRADGIMWVGRPAPDEFVFEYQSTSEPRRSVRQRFHPDVSG